MSYWQWFLLLVLVFWVGLYTVLWGSTEVGGNCVRKDGGQYTFEWLCADNGIITLAQSDNIKKLLHLLFSKSLVIGHGKQEKRLGIREDPKYITCRRYKRVQARTDNRSVYIREQTIHTR